MFRDISNHKAYFNNAFTLTRKKCVVKELYDHIFLTYIFACCKFIVIEGSRSLAIRYNTSEELYSEFGVCCG